MQEALDILTNVLKYVEQSGLAALHPVEQLQKVNCQVHCPRNLMSARAWA